MLQFNVIFFYLDEIIRDVFKLLARDYSRQIVAFPHKLAALTSPLEDRPTPLQCGMVLRQRADYGMRKMIL